MRIEVNGEPLDLDGPVRLGELVDGRVASRKGVAVAVAGEVVPRTTWDDIELTEGDRIEIVGAVQGG
jgi:sulfur carrier protein